MLATAIRPTVTQRVRAFLDEQGARIRPWSGLDVTYKELYSLLDDKKGDPDFWQPLCELLSEIIEDATDPAGRARLGAPQAELLKSWDIDNLVRDLRGALIGDRAEGDISSTKRFLMGLPAQVLGGFLLFGLAAFGCDRNDSLPVIDEQNGDAGTDSDIDTDTDTDADVDTDAEDTDSDSSSEIPDWAEGCDLDSNSILWSTLSESSIDTEEKKDLCTCFFSLNSSWENGLTELFENGTPEQIAAALENMIYCCEDEESLDTDFDAVHDAFWSGELCDGVPIYKGVSFPSRR